MRIDWSTLALQLVNFAILVWLLQRFLYRPVLREIDARRAAIEAERAEAAKTKESAAVERAALEAARAGVTVECAAALKAAAAQAEEVASARRLQSERDARALIETTNKTLAEARERVLDELQDTALDLATKMTQRMLAELPDELRDELWLERIEKHLAALPPTERAAFADESATGAAAHVVTASTLPIDRMAAWRVRLCKAIGRDVAITFETDPTLIAGAELCLPHSTLGVSLQRVIETVREEYRSHVRSR